VVGAALITLLSLGTDLEDHELTDDGFEHGDLDNFEEEEWWTGDESEDSECEQDIEEHEYTTPGDTARTVKIRLFLTDEGVDQSM
jgi:hypothetical protein